MIDFFFILETTQTLAYNSETMMVWLFRGTKTTWLTLRTQTTG